MRAIAKLSFLLSIVFVVSNAQADVILLSQEYSISGFASINIGNIVQETYNLTGHEPLSDSISLSGTTPEGYDALSHANSSASPFAVYAEGWHYIMTDEAYAEASAFLTFMNMSSDPTVQINYMIGGVAYCEAGYVLTDLTTESIIDEYVFHGQIGGGGFSLPKEYSFEANHTYGLKLYAFGAGDTHGYTAGAAEIWAELDWSQFPAPDLAEVGEKKVQYSDPLSYTLSAIDSDSPCMDLTFSAIGLPSGMALTNNGDCTASVWGMVQAAAATYNVTYKVTDASGGSDTEFNDIVVTREDANLTYTGDTIKMVGSPTTLVAVVNEVADGSPGDITKAAVYFDLTAAIGGSTTTYGPVAATANGKVFWTFPNGLPANVYSVDVRMDPANSYYEAEPAVTAVLVVYDPSAGYTTGGGWVTDGDENGNLGFTVAYIGKQTNVKGQAVYVFWDGQTVKRVKSNAMLWLVIRGNTAIFRGKATVNDAGNYTFEITVVDNGEPGFSDLFSIKIWRPDNTLLHAVPKTTLGGGNVIVPHP